MIRMWLRLTLTNLTMSLHHNIAFPIRCGRSIQKLHLKSMGCFVLLTFLYKPLFWILSTGYTARTAPTHTYCTYIHNFWLHIPCRDASIPWWTPEARLPAAIVAGPRVRSHLLARQTTPRCTGFPPERCRIHTVRVLIVIIFLIITTPRVKTYRARSKVKVIRPHLLPPLSS